MNRLLALLPLLSITAFTFASGLDDFIGEYKTKSGSGEAVISKILVEPATLFESAKYEYVLSVDHSKIQLSLENEKLTPNSSQKELSLETEIECDDPGCYYFTQVDVVVKRAKNNAPYISIYYSGYVPEPEEGQKDEFQGTAIFFKKH